MANDLGYAMACLIQNQEQISFKLENLKRENTKDYADPFMKEKLISDYEEKLKSLDATISILGKINKSYPGGITEQADKLVSETISMIDQGQKYIHEQSKKNDRRFKYLAAAIIILLIAFACISYFCFDLGALVQDWRIATREISTGSLGQ